MDAIGNLNHDVPSNSWITQARVSGTPGDVFLLIAGVGYFDTVTVGGAVFDNRNTYEHSLTPFGSTGIDLTNSVTVLVGTIGAGGFTDVSVSFGGFAQFFVESEVYLQALTLGPAGQAEISNRFQVDMNL